MAMRSAGTVLLFGILLASARNSFAFSRRGAFVGRSAAGRSPSLKFFPRQRQQQRLVVTNGMGGATPQSYDGARIGPPPDLPSLLLHNRIVYIGMPLVPAVTELIIAELLYLNYESGDKVPTLCVPSDQSCPF